MKIEGIGRLEAAMARRLAGLEGAVSGAVGAGVSAMAAEARTLAPQRTGRLVVGIEATRPRVRAGKITAAVVCSGGDDHAKPAEIEFGNRYTPAHPFMRPAFRLHAEPTVEGIADAVAGALS